MKLRSAVDALLRVSSPGLLRSGVLLPLRACAGVFGAVVRLRRALYAHGIMTSHRLSCPVIAVGNITVGGTGKTPTVAALAAALHQRGHRVAVLTRGYRGRSVSAPCVVSDGSTIHATAVQAGDEALMLARQLPGIPVLAAKDRVAAGQVAVARFQSGVIILDDGFQYHRLCRDVDIVLLNARDPFGNGFLLPRGTLREELSALSRASLILLSKTGSDGAALREVSRHAPDVPVFTAALHSVACRRAASAQTIALESLAGTCVVGLCSIGDPEYFFSMLQNLGVARVERCAFPDHHAFTDRDWRSIAACAATADWIVTTEKDIAKIDPGVIKNDKLLVLEVRQVISDEHNFLKTVTTLAGLA